MVGNFPPEQIARAQKWQQQHQDWDIRSVDGGDHFIAEHIVPDGTHIITRPGLGELLDRLESRETT